MNQWLPVRDILLNMMIEHIPSPINARAHKYHKLYSQTRYRPVRVTNCQKEINEFLINYQNGAFMFCKESRMENR